MAVPDAVVSLEPVHERLVPGELGGSYEVEPVADRLAVLLLDRREVERWSRDAFRRGHDVLPGSGRPGRLAALTSASNEHPPNGHGRQKTDADPAGGGRRMAGGVELSRSNRQHTGQTLVSLAGRLRDDLYFIQLSQLSPITFDDEEGHEDVAIPPSVRRDQIPWQRGAAPDYHRRGRRRDGTGIAGAG